MNRLLVTALMIILMLISCGEKEKIVEVPVMSDCDPCAPQGVFSENRDGFVRIYWYTNVEEDVIGYGIYRSTHPDTGYSEIGVRYNDDFEPDEYLYWFDDFKTNGRQHYYAVLAFDSRGNESPLSYDLVSGTARPEGLLKLWSRDVRADSSGYDFDSISNIAQWDTMASTDIFFTVGATSELVVSQPKVRIQDYGWVSSFDAINYGPPDYGWAPSGRVEAIEEHCYIVRLGESDGVHYTKLYVWKVTDEYVRFWWAYQTDPYNRDLAVAPAGGDNDGRRARFAAIAVNCSNQYRCSQLVDDLPQRFGRVTRKSGRMTCSNKPFF